MPKWTNEQLLAINEENNNIIVSAGAGSGKTAVLTERVITKLKKGIHINELLILTFTNKAAKEMKERIRKAIKKDEKLKNELDILDSSYITTFDSYALSVVKKYHYLLNVSKDISIVDNSLLNIKKQEIMEEIFNKRYEKQEERFLKFITDFCVKDDKKIRDSILNVAEKINLLIDKSDYLKSYVEKYYNEENINCLSTQYEELLINKIKVINDLLNDLKVYADSSYYEKCCDALKELSNSKNYNEIKKNAFISLPNVPKNSEEALKNIKKEIMDVIKNIKELTVYEDIRSINNYLLKTKDNVSLIIDIIKEYNYVLEKYKLENEIFEFVDIAMLAIKVLKENEEERLELKNSFYEIMVDEYQDTSDIQEEFIRLISSNNVYMVGDIKQSIYRFRNANPYIFKNKYDLYSQNINGIKIDLNKNFRSREEVLRNINTLFDQLMDDEVGGANYKLSHRMIFGNLLYNLEGKTNQNNDFEIRLYNHDKDISFDKEEIEAFEIARDIKEKINNKYQIFDKEENVLRDAKYSDFVILIDRATSFEKYKKIFEYLNLPLSILKDENLSDSDIFYIFSNLLKLVIKIKKQEFDEEFRHAFISVSRSFLLRLSDQEIFNIFIENSFSKTDIYKKCEQLAKDLDSLSTKEVFEQLITLFDVYEKLILVGNVNDLIIRINKLLSISLSFSNIGYTPYDFSLYLEKIIDNSFEMKTELKEEDSDSVKIMTIHKSKGLEYHVCYYSLLYKSFNISDLNEKFMFDNKYGIVAPLFDEGILETIVKDLIKEKYKKEEISEKIRLFYVALTRAKEKMILLVPESSFYKESINKLNIKCFSDMLSMLNKSLDKYVSYINFDELNLTKDYLNVSKKEIKEEMIDKRININEVKIDNEIINSLSFSKKENKLMDLKMYNNIKIGKEIHKILEMIDFKNVNYDLIDNKFLKEKVYNLINSPILSNISEKDIYKEYEFVYMDEMEERHGIIDLMLVSCDCIDIVDYKLKNIDDDLYKRQLCGYKRFIETKYEKPVNLYLYSIMEGSIKKVDEEV